MKILYTQRASGLPAGVLVRNPIYFQGPERGAVEVSVDGEYPHIVEAYKVAGVDVQVLGLSKSVGGSPNFDDMTVADLQAHLTSLGITYSLKAKKDELLALAKEA